MAYPLTAADGPNRHSPTGVPEGGSSCELVGAKIQWGRSRYRRPRICEANRGAAAARTVALTDWAGRAPYVGVTGVTREEDAAGLAALFRDVGLVPGRGSGITRHVGMVGLLVSDAALRGEEPRSPRYLRRALLGRGGWFPRPIGHVGHRSCSTRWTAGVP